MNCPQCGTPMNSAARVYDRWVKGMLAGALCLMLMASGPCIDNSSWFRVGAGQPVMENPDVDRA